MSEYIKGFDAGYNYVLNEIENFRENYDGAPNLLLSDLLSVLRMEHKNMEDV
jgi:hypothetical protein